MRVEVLGPVRVNRDDGYVEVPRRTERALLAALALRAGHVVPMEVLVEALWASDPPATARRSAGSHLSRLRQRLGPDVAQPEAGGYRMALPGGCTDVGALNAAVVAGAAARQQGDPATARRCFAEGESLWRGPPLTDLADSPVRTAEIERLQSLRWRAREGRLCCDLDLGGHDLVVDEARELLAQDPLREDVWRILMLGLYRSGRQVDALRAYRQLHAALAREWAVDPSPELQRLNWQILRQDPQLDLRPPSPPLRVPASLSSFVGRVGQVDAVAQALPTDRLVTLHGMAGVGKSRLAQEVARQVLGRFPDGVWWVDLAAATDAAGALARLTATLGVVVTPGLSAQDALTAHLRHRELLLVLDNCEHVAEGLAHVVLGLLRAGAGLRVLATSRVYLGVSGESRWEVPPLGVPELGADEESSETADAVVLFQQRRGRRVDLPVVNTIADVAVLCRHLDGVPLALELAAAQAQRQSVGEIMARLGADLLDSSLVAAGTSHHLNVRGAIDWSYCALDPLEQHLFDRLAVFPGDFDAAAAQSVARGIAGLPDDSVVTVLSSLVDASMVQARLIDSPTRYRLLFVMREFARSRLAERGEAELAAEAFSDHYRRVASDAAPRLDAEHPRVRLGRLASEAVNLEKAFLWSMEHGPAAHALQFISAMGRVRFGTSPGLLADITKLRRVVEDATEVPAGPLGWAWLALVPAGYMTGDLLLALEACERAQALFTPLGDQAGLAAVDLGRGTVLFLAAGDLPAAETSLRQGLRAARIAGATTIEAWCLAYLVHLQCYAGTPTAETHEALSLALRLAGDDDELMRLHLTADQAMVQYGQGDLDACIGTTDRLESLSLAAGDWVYGQFALVFRGAALLRKGDCEAARLVLLRGARTAVDIGNRVQLEVFAQELAQIADNDDPVRAARLWGAGTAHTPVWPGYEPHWFPSQAQRALGERFGSEVELGRVLDPESVIELATG